ncbi:hypothetical protein D3C80_1935030 [compost metagenome]
MHRLVGIKAIDATQQLLFGYIGRQSKFEGVHASSLGRDYLVPDVYVTRRIATYENDRQTRCVTVLICEITYLECNPLTQSQCCSLSINQLS